MKTTPGPDSVNTGCRKIYTRASKNSVLGGLQ